MGFHQFQELPAVMNSVEKRMANAISLVVQKAALAGGNSLAEETPVDTGVARSNWVMTIDSGFAGLIPAYVPYPSYRDSHHTMVKTAVLRTAGRRVTVKNFSPSSFGA